MAKKKQTQPVFQKNQASAPRRTAPDRPQYAHPQSEQKRTSTPRPVYDQEQPAPRRAAPARPSYTTPQESKKRTAPTRPVYDQDREAKKRTPPARMQYGAPVASPRGVAAQPSSENTVGHSAKAGRADAPLQHAAQALRNASGAGRENSDGRKTGRNAAPPRQRAWHARPEQEAALKPRAPLYDQQAERPAPAAQMPPQEGGVRRTAPASAAARGSAKRKRGKRTRAGHATPSPQAPAATAVPPGEMLNAQHPGAALKANRETLPGDAVKNKKPRRPRRKKREKRPLTPEQARRRRAREKLITGVVLCILLAAGILFSAAVVFKIKNLQVVRPQGDTVYTDAEILAAFGQPLGENLFGFDADVCAQNVAAALPYLESVSVQRSLPDTVSITVVPAYEYAAVACDAGWAVVSQSMKVLRLDSAPPEGLLVVEGVQADNPTPGQPLALTEPDKLTTLCTLLEKTQAQGLVPVTQIDLEDLWEISFLYDGRICIVLGTANDLDYKLEWAWRLVTPQTDDSLADTEWGTLDVSSRNSDGRGQAIWRAGVL